ncbi:hypothetical protein RFI_38267, partial [Reticulomyxa filosa]
NRVVNLTLLSKKHKKWPFQKTKKGVLHVHFLFGSWNKKLHIIEKRNLTTAKCSIIVSIIIKKKCLNGINLKTFQGLYRIISITIIKVLQLTCDNSLFIVNTKE